MQIVENERSKDVTEGGADFKNVLLFWLRFSFNSCETATVLFSTLIFLTALHSPKNRLSRESNHLFPSAFLALNLKLFLFLFTSDLLGFFKGYSLDNKLHILLWLDMKERPSLLGGWGWGRQGVARNSSLNFIPFIPRKPLLFSLRLYRISFQALSWNKALMFLFEIQV